MMLSNLIFCTLSWQAEYPKYTQLLAKILEGVLSQGDVKDKCQHLEEVSLFQSFLFAG